MRAAKVKHSRTLQGQHLLSMMGPGEALDLMFCQSHCSGRGEERQGDHRGGCRDNPGSSDGGLDHLLGSGQSPGVFGR